MGGEERESDRHPSEYCASHTQLSYSPLCLQHLERTRQRHKERRMHKAHGHLQRKCHSRKVANDDTQAQRRHLSMTRTHLDRCMENGAPELSFTYGHSVFMSCACHVLASLSSSLGVRAWACVLPGVKGWVGVNLALRCGLTIWYVSAW